jgi:hypothetical protein
MDALYRYGAPYGMGEEPTQTSGEPGKPTSTWDAIKNISASLVTQGIRVAPQLISGKLKDKLAALTGGGAAKKSGAAPTAAAPASYRAAPAARGGLPGWAIPVAVGAAAFVGVVFFMRRRKG